MKRIQTFGLLVLIICNGISEVNGQVYASDNDDDGVGYSITSGIRHGPQYSSSYLTSDHGTDIRSVDQNHLQIIEEPGYALSSNIRVGPGFSDPTKRRDNLFRRKTAQLRTLKAAIEQLENDGF